jgi:hypothetical protein
VTAVALVPPSEVFHKPWFCPPVFFFWGGGSRTLSPQLVMDFCIIISSSYKELFTLFCVSSLAYHARQGHDGSDVVGDKHIGYVE